MEAVVIASCFIVICLQAVIAYILIRGKRPGTAVAQKDSGTSNAVILDSCALIDGRIRDLAKAGFIPGAMFVPQRVVEELQYLADHGDTYKRARARYGLDTIKNLQDSHKDKVSLLEGGDATAEVDEVLVGLALQHNAALYTTDYNLNKVARIRGVHVLNVNELAHALRPMYLPGEKVSVKIVQKGESAGQGVGYLEDGTMVVVNGAAKKIGVRVTAQTERMLHTEAGRMLFTSVCKN